MKAGILGRAARWPLVTSAVALVSAAVLQTVRQVTDFGHTWLFSLAVGVVLPFALILWSASFARSYHPATLVARPSVPAFDVPVNPGAVLGAAGYTFLVANVVRGSVSDVAAGQDVWFSVVLAVLVLLLVVPFWRLALGRAGVRLSPDGIHDRQVIGSLFVPWDALATPEPARAYDTQRVILSFAHPEQVRRRGLRIGDRTWLPASGVDAEMLAGAIHEYVNRPDLRASIGSPAELERLRAVPAG
jgi:hypothetical protein